MRLIPKVLWIGAALVTVLAVLILLLDDPRVDPPRTAASPGLTVGEAKRAPAIAELLAPWVRPAPPTRVVPAPTAAPAPTAVPDRTLLKYIGAVQTELQKRYFFKVNSTGQVLSLVPGEENKGWLLRSVEAQRFQLRGPGGDYEVAR